jgi:ribosomal protein S18 acetylase RimI-like enzyme
MMDSTVEIRPYIDADEEWVIALWDGVFPYLAPHNEPMAELQRKLGVERELLFVAVVDSRVVGTVMGGYDGHRGWVYLLAVAPEHRGKGIGRALMRRLETEFDQRGCPKVNLQVRGDNPDVVAFYETIGYKVEDRISMGKRLYKEP